MPRAEFYDVIKQGTFYIQIAPCHKIEELSDTFMTREALELMNAGNDNWEWHSCIYLGAEITEALKEWIEMIPEGCQSTSKKTPKINIMYRELTHDQIRNRMPSGYTIRGNKIINEERQIARIGELAEQEKERAKRLREAKAAAPYVRPDYITQTDVYHIREAFHKILGREYTMNCSRAYHYTKEHSIFKFMKRLTNWDEIAKEHRKHARKKEYSQDLKYMKQVWDNPSLDPSLEP